MSDSTTVTDQSNIAKDRQQQQQEQQIPQNTLSDATVTEENKKPPACLVIGMAGCGKTTIMQRMNAHIRTKRKVPYILNLDPAVNEIPYPANIDIRDTVDYKQVMSQYQLGPNGGILTSLNLFATRFDKVLEFVDKRVASNQVHKLGRKLFGGEHIYVWVLIQCI